MSAPEKAGEPGRPQSRRQIEARRRFLRSVGLAVGMTGAGLLGYLPLAALARPRLRPPGAIEERAFLSACIKCGQCVQVCPVEAIVLADLSDGFGVGVPYLDARAQACDFSCDAVQCVLACPTGALTHDISTKEEVRMGLARLARPEACLAVRGEGFRGLARGPDFHGLHRYADVDRWNPIRVRDRPYDLALCDLCVRECPIDRAIRLEPIAGAGPRRARPVVGETCVGCGMCEMMCPVEPAAIVVDERVAWSAP